VNFHLAERSRQIVYVLVAVSENVSSRTAVGGEFPIVPQRRPNELAFEGPGASGFAPSPDDHELTRRLAAAGAVMGIDLDHIVLGGSRHSETYAGRGPREEATLGTWLAELISIS
jgi:hypothetical protein